MASRFLYDFCPIPDLYAELPDFYSGIFPTSSTLPETYVAGSPLIVSSPWPRIAHVRCAIEGGEGRFMQVAKMLSQVCSQNYFSALFIAPIQGPILSPSLFSGPVEDWVDNLHGSCRSTTSLPQLLSGHCPNHVRVKVVPCVFLP